MNPVSDVMLLWLCIYQYICIIWNICIYCMLEIYWKNTMSSHKYSIIFSNIYLDTVASVIFSIVGWVKDWLHNKLTWELNTMSVLLVSLCLDVHSVLLTLLLMSTVSSLHSALSWQINVKIDDIVVHFWGYACVSKQCQTYFSLLFGAMGIVPAIESRNHTYVSSCNIL